jgi:membrane-associated phospholipid phosphatase
VERQVAAFASNALSMAPGDPPGRGSRTAGDEGCASAPEAGACASSFGGKIGHPLGVILGAGAGFGLGQREPDGPLAREFKPFGLTDSLITAGAAAIAWRGYKLVEGPLPPLRCEIGPSGCRTPTDVNRVDAGVRRALVWSSPKARTTANTLSYTTLWATLALPSAFLLGSDQPRQGREFWLTVESGAITSALLQVVKRRVHRPRPYAHYCEVPCGVDLSARDSRLSFFSGHAGLAFSFATSMGTIASMRGYRHSGWVLGSGLALAGSTAYLRIAADRHYLTDVVVGALVGSAIGWAVPKLHGTQDRPEKTPPTARPAREAPALVLPVPLRGGQGGMWLRGSVGRGAELTLTWAF